MQKIVLCVYPRAGLANKLLVLAKSYSRAYDSGAIVIETLFAQLPLLSSLKNRCQPRSYLSSPIQKHLFGPLIWSFLYKLRIINLVSRVLSAFIHIEIIDYFDSYPLHASPYNDLVNKSLGELTKSALRGRLGVKPRSIQHMRSKKKGVASVHIRLGDFEVRADKAIGPNSRTSINYFQDIIVKIASFYENEDFDWTLKVFTDDKNALTGTILDNNRIHLCSGDPFNDFIEQINCDVLVPSPWSTFSGLAAHLSFKKLIVVPTSLHFQFSPNNLLTVVSPENLNFSLKTYYSSFYK